MFAYDKTFDPEVVLGHYDPEILIGQGDLISRFNDFALYIFSLSWYMNTLLSQYE